MTNPNASFYGGSGRFCINCLHYIQKKTSRDDLCRLSGSKCSRARMNGGEHGCGSDAQYFAPKGVQEANGMKFTYRCEHVVDG